MSAMRLLVTGAAGMLGRDVVAAAGDAGHEVAALARADLDITDAAAVRAAVAGARPDAVINCAAWTDVDGAEAAEAAATAVNGAGAGHVAAAAAEAGALVVHVSTDYVVRRRRRRAVPRGRADRSRARAYGRSKLAGELAVAAAARRCAIVRSSWLFGPHGRNFVDTMRRLGAERDEVAVVDDQVGCPTYTGHLAPALVEIAERGLTGVLHVAGGGRCSWFELAEATFAETGLQLPRAAPEHRRRSAARPRAPPSRRSPAPAATRPSCPLARGTARPSRPRGGHRMRLLVCGGAGFIGSNFVRQRARRARRRDHGARQAHLRRPAREPRRARRAAGRRRHRGPDSGRRGDRGLPTRSSTSPPRRTSTARSAEPDAFVTTHALGTYTLLEAARERGLRYVQVSTDEVYGSIEEGSFTEQSPLQPSSPYSATKAGADLLVASYRHTSGSRR